MSGQQCPMKQERLRETGIEKHPLGLAAWMLLLAFLQSDFSKVVGTDNKDMRIQSEKAETVIIDCVLRTLARKGEERGPTSEGRSKLNMKDVDWSLTEPGFRGDGMRNTGGRLALTDRSETLSLENWRENVRRGGVHMDLSL